MFKVAVIIGIVGWFTTWIYTREGMKSGSGVAAGISMIVLAVVMGVAAPDDPTDSVEK